MSLISKANIQAYLPQHPPFLMVDQLDFCNEKSASTSFLILADNVLVEHHIFSEAGLLENMAQTCAIHAGYSFAQHKTNSLNTANENKSPVGFIGAVKDFQLYHLPKVNDILSTTITIEHQFGNASVVRGEVMVNGIIAATTEMKIFLQD